MKVLKYAYKRGQPDKDEREVVVDDVVGTLYHVRLRLTDGDKADDTAKFLAIEHVSGEIYKCRLPKHKALVQIEGLVSEAWFPRLYEVGDIRVYGAERIRYQTLRDGVLYTPTKLVDAMLIDSRPYEVLNPEATYRLPKREGDFYIGPNYIVGTGQYLSHGSRVTTVPGGTSSHAYDVEVTLPAGVYRPEFAKSILANHVGRTHQYYLRLPDAVNAESVRPVVDGFTKWTADIDWTHPHAPPKLASEDALRLKTVIDTLRDLHNPVDNTADATWLLRCVVSGRDIQEYVYFNGKPKGVYAKEISDS